MCLGLEIALLGIIREVQTISKIEIAKKMNVSRPTVSRLLNSLRKLYRVEWVGGTRNGHWEVSEK